MKKNFLFVALATLCMSASQAMAESPYPYIKLVQDSLSTIKANNENGEFVEHSGSYRAGQQSYTLSTMIYGSLMPKPFEKPDTTADPFFCEIQVNDLQEKPVTEFTKRENLNERLIQSIMAARMSSQPMSYDWVHSFILERGGEYKVRMQFSPTGLDSTVQLVFPDYPTWRMFDRRADSNVGQPVCFQVRYNSGYPYEPSSYIDGLYAKLTLTDTTFKVLGTKQIPLTFKTKPLYKKAVIDTLQLDHDPLPAGKYYVIHETNWQVRPGASLKDTMTMFVNDTVRASSSINKAEFTRNETVDIDYSVSYGYPYISVKDSVTKKPFVNVTVVIVDSVKAKNQWDEEEFKKLVVLQQDTNRIMDDSLAFKALDHKGAFHLALNAIPDSVLNKKIYAIVEVYFNQYSHYRKTYPLTVTGKPTAITNVAEEQETMYYDLLGRPVGTKPSVGGIYVTKGKKVLVR